MRSIPSSITRHYQRLRETRRGQRLIPALRPEFSHLQLGTQAMQRLLDAYDFRTVLDVGSGDGCHAACFMDAGKVVTTIDYGRSPSFLRKSTGIQTIIADFNGYAFPDPFDCVWCCHVLEHQLDAHTFLRGLHRAVKEGGILAITIPPFRETIVGGHVSFWNAGLLLYRLVLAGFDCREASLLRYGYNISVILRKQSVDVLPALVYDAGDIKTIRPYLPACIAFVDSSNDTPFDGAIHEINWAAHPQAGNKPC